MHIKYFFWSNQLTIFKYGFYWIEWYLRCFGNVVHVDIVTQPIYFSILFLRERECYEKNSYIIYGSKVWALNRSSCIISANSVKCYYKIAIWLNKFDISLHCNRCESCCIICCNKLCSVGVENINVWKLMKAIHYLSQLQCTLIISMNFVTWQPSYTDKYVILRYY